MKNHPVITANTYRSLSKMQIKLKKTESWRGKIPTHDGFSKTDKEGLNVMNFALLVPIMIPDEDLTGLPAYVMKRLYRKAYTWDMKPKNTKFFRENVLGFDDEVDAYVEQVLETEGNGEFARFLREEAAKLSPKVLRVYKAARVLGTLIEWEEMHDRLRPDSVEETRQQVYQDLHEYEDLPHFFEIANGVGEYGRIKTLVRSMSAARYTFRWQGYIAPIRCSILAHMLESALISYLMNLEMERDTDVVHDFWVMAFHDLPEIWTDDVPSPVKDGMQIHNPSSELVRRIGKEEITLRDITELQELEALDVNFYSKLPEEVANFFRNGVMLEDVKDPSVKKFFKAADYFSADLECYWEIKSGSREAAFRDIMIKSISGNRTPAQKELLKQYVDVCKTVTFFD